MRTKIFVVHLSLHLRLCSAFFFRFLASVSIACAFKDASSTAAALAATLRRTNDQDRKESLTCLQEQMDRQYNVDRRKCSRTPEVAGGLSSKRHAQLGELRRGVRGEPAHKMMSVHTPFQIESERQPRESLVKMSQTCLCLPGGSLLQPRALHGICRRAFGPQPAH